MDARCNGVDLVDEVLEGVEEAEELLAIKLPQNGGIGLARRRSP